MDHQIGDAVKLNGQSQVMTIDDIDGEDAECVWQDKQGIEQRGFYNLKALRKHVSGQAGVSVT